MEILSFFLDVFFAWLFWNWSSENYNEGKKVHAFVCLCLSAMFGAFILNAII
jgi:hypothetical protein